jgi:hypothetical protein
VIKTEARRRPPGAVGLVFLASLLCGCMDTTLDRDTGPSVATVARQRVTARTGVSPRGASLAFVSLDGPPEAVSVKFREQFDKAAQSREVALAKTEAAQYRLRVYLTALPAQAGTRLISVLDVYDRQGRRVQRLSDEVAVRSDANPWDAINDNSLAAIADRGAEDVAAFLSNTPEALAATEKDAGVSVVAGQAKIPDDKPKVSGVAQAR